MRSTALTVKNFLHQRGLVVDFFKSRFDPTRLIPIATTESRFIAIVYLESDVGAKVIAHSIIRHFKLIGVIDDCDDVTVAQNEKTLIFWVERPVFDVEGHLEES
jgi:hypothetical protein